MLGVCGVIMTRIKVHGAAMGALIANLFMEEFKVKALSSALHTLHLWLRYVDDTFII